MDSFRRGCSSSNGQKQQAYELLNDKHWLGKAEDERQMRLALIQLNDNPLEALEI